ncbi:MAG: MaoC family dehydratase [Chromatiales bacterium]|nr:MAG: MaoC family dehydratase [Chromatiales bacterium]
MSVTIGSIADAQAREGEELGVSNWIFVDQERIDRFAKSTDDFQWIHVDPERAKAELPIGSTIAHGFLLISLIPAAVDQFVVWKNLDRAINYGLNKVRFKNMVPSGSRVRIRSKLMSARKRAGALQAILEHTMEIEGETKAACVAETISMYFFSDD